MTISHTLAAERYLREEGTARDSSRSASKRSRLVCSHSQQWVSRRNFTVRLR
jgi:hypothetical protein